MIRSLLTVLLLAIAATLAAQDRSADARPKSASEASAALDTPEARDMLEAWQKASTPGPQHRQLAEHFVGTWDTRQRMWMEPGAPPVLESGRDVSTVEFGGRHVRSEFTGQFMGQPFQGRALTSYDNVTGKYLSSWVDSMSTGHFIAVGDFDPATSTYTFHGELPDPMKPGGMVAVREVIRIEGPDRHVLEYHERHGDEERKTMEIVYTRAR
jgi:hypothetical protein